MNLEISYTNDNVRVYKQDGKVVACATSQDNFDNLIHYFCLPHIWQQGYDTTWVNIDELNSMIED